MRGGTVISLEAREAKLKRAIRAHLRRVGFTRSRDGALLLPSYDKDGYRRAHFVQRQDLLKANWRWIESHKNLAQECFAIGNELDISRISVSLVPVEAGRWTGDLFRLATYFWRVPISVGYGRRMRFLVWDDYHQKLIGIFGLGDVVFNLRARDELIGWDANRRKDALVNVMDAYALGAVPPYSMILGGKLVASMVRTQEVVDAFRSKYGATVGQISGKAKNAKLAVVTTTSALGRSSLYNRLSLHGQKIFQSIGETSGFGHFHISNELFEEIKDYLRSMGDASVDAHGYGQGPNYRFRIIRHAFHKLDLSQELVRHGLSREIFMCQFSDESCSYLRGEVADIDYSTVPLASQLGRAALERWVMPRSLRDTGYKAWTPSMFVDDLAAGIAPRAEQRFRQG